MILHQLTQLHFLFEPCLGVGYGFLQDLRVFIPGLEALEVGGSGFVGEDEGADVVAEAFLQEDDAACAAVVVVEGADAFKLDVEAQEPVQVGREAFVVPDEVCQGPGDLLWGQAEGGRGGTVFTDAGFSADVGAGAVGQQAVIAADQIGRQRLGDGVHGLPDAGKVVHRFDQVVHFHGLEGHAHLAGAVYILNLIAGQAVACHAA